MSRDVLTSVDGGQADFELDVVQQATVHLEAADLLALFDDPFTVVAAPGAGKWLRVLHVGWEWKYGSGRYSALHPELLYDGDSEEIVLVDFDAAVSRVGAPAFVGIDWLRTVVENKALVFGNGDPEDPVWTSTIVTSTLADGGSGYAIGDTGMIGNGDDTYVVDSVGGGGEVLTYSVVGTSPNYNTVSNPLATTVITGIGDGLFTINVTEVTPADGDLYVTVDYVVETLH